MLLGVGAFELRFDQAHENVVGVPAAAKALALSQLDDFLVGRSPAQREHVDPGDPTKELPNLSIRLLVPSLVALACERTPKGSIGTIDVFLNGPSADGQNGRIAVVTQLLVGELVHQSVELQNQLVFLWRQFLVDAGTRVAHSQTGQDAPWLQSHQEVRQFFEQGLGRAVLVAELQLAEHVFQLGGQLGEHLDHGIGLVVMRQTSQRLEQHGKALEFVPKREHHADLLDVVARRVPFEKVCLAALLLLNVELGLLGGAVGNESLHEVFRVYGEEDLGRKRED